MKQYIIQSILIDEHGPKTIETVTHSLRSSDYETALDYLMKKHRSSRSFLYIVMDIETEEIIIRTKENKYSR